MVYSLFEFRIDIKQKYLQFFFTYAVLCAIIILCSTSSTSERVAILFLLLYHRLELWLYACLYAKLQLNYFISKGKNFEISLFKFSLYLNNTNIYFKKCL